MAAQSWDGDASIPSLMREARSVYRNAAHRALVEIGCDDIPRNGAFVLAGLDNRVKEPMFSSQSDVVASLKLSKQAASQLLDSLVLRGYLDRRSDPNDRRRMGLRLTDRGRRAAHAIRTATEAIDTALAKQISADELHGLRVGLAAFREIRDQT
ncbi:MAG: MarR family transcriptional regulator [Acidimicrobiales bacterium]